MRKNLQLSIVPMLFTLLLPCLVQADDSWTDVGIYAFASDIKGDVRVGNVTADVDLPFEDLIKNVDIGFMGFAEHRRGKWSFIGDVFYIKLSADDTFVSNRELLTVEADVVLEQILVEAFVGYRVFEQKNGSSEFGVDILAGLRYNKIEAELGTEVSLLGLSSSSSRNSEIDWTDSVIAVRAQYSFGNGWGISGWVDAGAGSDSNSHQFIGLVNYKYSNNLKVFAGYREYSFKYADDSGALPFKLDLDYQGPILGISTRF